MTLELWVHFDGGCLLSKVVIFCFVFPCLFLFPRFLASFPPSLSLCKEQRSLIIVFVLGKWCIGCSKVSVLEIL